MIDRFGRAVKPRPPRNANLVGKMKEETRKALQDLLGQLPDDKAVPLAAAIEMDRVKGQHNMPYEDILDGLRPVLAKSKLPPLRVPTPMRVFCEVFEDLIYVGVSRKKQRGRIDRNSLNPIWNWLGQDLISDMHGNLTGKLKTHIIASEKEKRDAVVAQLHEAAAEALTRALENLEPGTEPYQALAQKLGNSKIIEDARDIALVLSIAPQITHLQKMFPKPIKRLSQTDIESIRRYYDFLARNTPTHLPAVFYMFMGRMADPWFVLPVARSLVSSDGKTTLGTSPLGFLGNLLLNEVEALASYVQSALAHDTPGDAVLDALNEFARLIEGLTSEIAVDDPKEWRQTLIDCRALVGGAMEMQLEKIPQIVMAALPAATFGNFAGKFVIKADLASWPDPDKVGVAMTQAAILGGARQFATQAAFATVHGEMVDRVGRFLLQYGDSVVDEIRASDLEDRDRARAHLEIAVRLTQYVLGDTEADLLWQRGLDAAA